MKLALQYVAVIFLSSLLPPQLMGKNSEVAQLVFPQAMEGAKKPPAPLPPEHVETEETEDQNLPEPCHRHLLIEGKAAYFHPTDSRIRNIYPGPMGLFGIEASYQAWEWIYGWASASYLTKSGHSLGKHNPTRATLVPLGLGFKFLHDFKFEKIVKSVGLYAGGGILGTYFHTRDHSHYVIPKPSKWSVGAIAKAGILIYPIESFFLDIFSEYAYMKFNFHDGHGIVTRHDVNFSGWSVGGALGYQY